MTKKADNEAGKPHRVTMFKGSLRPYPELYLEVFIAGPKWEEQAFAEMFTHAKCYKAASPEKADLVVFVGGADVTPSLYGEVEHSQTSTNHDHDQADLELYKMCFEQGIPMLGICRGAQFGHIMNGGKLYQDVDHHYGDHQIYDVIERRVVNPVSSVHHQMVVRNDKMEVVAENGNARTRWLNPLEKVTGNKMDVEAFFYRDTCFLGIQGHPEYRNYDTFLRWSLDKLVHYFAENPDLASSKGPDNRSYWRIKEDIRIERTQKKWDEYVNLEGFTGFDIEKVIKELA